MLNTSSLKIEVKLYLKKKMYSVFINTNIGTIKRIFSDSNNIFLWYESEDINKKRLFPKFQLIPILHFRVMHDYVRFIAPIGHCVEQILVYENFL